MPMLAGDGAIPDYFSCLNYPFFSFCKKSHCLSHWVGATELCLKNYIISIIIPELIS